MPEDLPDHPVWQLLEQMLNERESDKGKLVPFEDDVALLLQRLFRRKTHQAGDAATSQLPLFDEAERLAGSLYEVGNEPVVAPTNRLDERNPLPAELPSIEVVQKLPEHELTCACGCHKHVIARRQ